MIIYDETLENNQYLEEHPEEAFEYYIKRLGKINLKELLLFSSFISVFEFFDSIDFSYTVFAPLINMEQINLLSHAIIRSSSNMKKKGHVKKDDLTFFYHRWINLGGERIKEIEKNANTSMSAEQQFQAIMNMQFRFQNTNLTQRWTRFYIMYLDIPSRYEKCMQTYLKGSFVPIKKEFERKYGFPVLMYLFFGYFLFSLTKNYFREIFPLEYSIKHRRQIQKIDPKPWESGSKFLNDKIEGLYRIYSVNRDNGIERLVFRPSMFDHLPVKGFFNPYLKLMSKQISEFKSLAREKAYSEGIILDRLNPLERYPLIEFKKDEYIIPNIRFLSYSIFESFHYILQEIFPDNQYNQTLGYIQEIYIKELIGSSHKPCEMISEIEYERGKNLVKGPDLVLFSDSLCIIESKSKRPSAQLRSDPGSSLFSSQMINIGEAFTKGIDKINDIYSELGKYSTFHEAIIRTKKNQPIVIVVISDGFENPMDVLLYHVKISNFANLQTYPYRFALLTLSSLEEIISISTVRKIPVSRLFEHFCATSKNTSERNYMWMERFREKYSIRKTMDSPYFDQKQRDVQKEMSSYLKSLEK